MNQAFLSYARPDLTSAARLAADLRVAGATVWFDQDSLLPGQQWRVEIERAIRGSDFFIALLSSGAVNRRGFVQAELAKALAVLDEIPPAQIFLIPARLDDCAVSHQRLQDIHRVDLFPDWAAGLRRIVAAMGMERVPTERAPAIDSFRAYLATCVDAPERLKLWAARVDDELFLVTTCLAQTSANYAGPTRLQITECAHPLGFGRSVDELIHALSQAGILAPSTEDIRPGTYAEIDARRNPSYDFGPMFRLVQPYIRDAPVENT